MRLAKLALYVLSSQLSFFTIIPVPQRLVNINLALRYLDFSPLTVSTVLLLVLLPLDYVLSVLHVSSIMKKTLLYALTLVLTGFLHIDGFTDVIDAIFVPPERRLEVLKDPRVGACGAAALVLLLILGVIAVINCSVNPSLMLYISDLAGRATCSISARLGRPLHPGLGSLLVQELRSCRSLYRFGLLLPVVLTLSIAYMLHAVMLIVVATSLVLSVLVVIYVIRILGGISGDVLGFSIEISRHLTLITLSCVFHY